jgi:hypothetical protein
MTYDRMPGVQDEGTEMSCCGTRLRSVRSYDVDEATGTEMRKES